MGARFPSVVSTTFVGPLPANNTETVVCVSPPFSPPLDSTAILIFWYFSYVGGATNTFAQYNIRRGTTVAGASIQQGTWAFVASAGAGSTGGGNYVDIVPGAAGQQYALTLIQGTASGAGTFRDVCLLVMAL